MFKASQTFLSALILSFVSMAVPCQADEQVPAAAASATQSAVAAQDEPVLEAAALASMRSTLRP